MLEAYSGATRILPIIGHPIAQVKSPAHLTRGFEERGHDIIVVPFNVQADAIEAFLKTLDGVGNLAGILCTVPHKFAAVRFATTITDRAKFFGSANALRRNADGSWHADMLDGIALVSAITKGGGAIAKQNVLLIGAGGAGGAIALELLNAGALAIALHDTDVARRDLLLDKLNKVHPGKARLGSMDPTGFDVIVNATPLGMQSADPSPVILERLTSSMFVADVITPPDQPPLLRAAHALGCRTSDGHAMFDVGLGEMLDYFTQP